MNILILYPEVGCGTQWNELLAAGLIGAIARHEEHRCELLHYKHSGQLPGVEAAVRRFAPDLIIAHIAHHQWKPAQALLQAARRAAPNPMIVCAGLYPTLDPDSVIAEPAVDAVCVGESEAALEELMKRLSARQNCTDTPNFWFRQRTGLVKNALRMLVADVDTFPFTDRTLYDHAALVAANGGGFPILASRGCPQECLFCPMSRLKQISEGKGEFYRPRSALSIIAEVQAAARRQRIEWVHFIDPCFPLVPDYLDVFCDQWKVQARLPFRITGLAERLTMQALHSLRDAGCEAIELGIETGDEKFRARLGDRNLSNDRLLAIREECRRLGIAIITNSMVGFPLENPELARATAELNRRLKPDEAHVSIYRPVVGTPLYQFCRDNNYFKPDWDEVAWTPRRTFLNLPAFPERDLLNAYDQMRALDRQLQAERAGVHGGYFQFYAGIKQARIESAIQPALDGGMWSREGEERLCMFQAIGSKAIFPVELREGSALQFSVTPGPIPYAIPYTKSVQVEIRIQQGEALDVLFIHILPMAPHRSRRAWHDVRLPLEDWPAGPVEISFSTHALGFAPAAPVYVAWSNPVLIEGAEFIPTNSSVSPSKRLLSLERDLDALHKENESLRQQLESTRADLDQRKQRIGELHVRILELEKELEERPVLDVVNQKEVDGSVTGKIKKMFGKKP